MEVSDLAAVGNGDRGGHLQPGSELPLLLAFFWSSQRVHQGIPV